MGYKSPKKYNPGDNFLKSEPVINSQKLLNENNSEFEEFLIK